jgi:hypothetical protein
MYLHSDSEIRFSFTLILPIFSDKLCQDGFISFVYVILLFSQDELFSLIKMVFLCLYNQRGVLCLVKMQSFV